MERRRRQGNCIPQRNKSIEDLMEKEENAYLVNDLNRTMINITNELSRRKSWMRSLRNSWRSYNTWLKKR
jgi:hypothetical protein